MTPRTDADLLVVGAGPAGVSAILTATGLGLRTVLIEGDRVGAKLYAIGAMDNLPGGWSTGPQLARALDGDVTRAVATGLCSVEYQHAVKIHAQDDVATVRLTDGRELNAPAVVVATGVKALGPEDVSWLRTPEIPALPPLWRFQPANLPRSRGAVVLGADRPLGTWLRAHPEADVHLHVLHPESDGYKTAEVEHDRRVRLTAISQASVVQAVSGGFQVTAQSTDSRSRTFHAEVVLMNVGSKPAGLPGVSVAEDGYCPQEDQHPRILVAGDLKGPRMQRIAIAMGDGQRATLSTYYSENQVVRTSP
ncbi:NAD(P)/FAD-dependent oxidoreductase [Streptomyces scopuliridis]|uniref:NAD(P)/FAD-dependent oxidoreductase n=1 Tax=Streptomyces scopuliridis TaxID=452529 RepID=UPI0036C7330A